MKLPNGYHLAYCTNIHRGETWAETFDGLQRYTLEVKRRVCPDEPYAIGLRLGHEAARELSGDGKLEAFQAWLDENDCYVFTINGFPYGQFHGTRVKEHVYAPDWTTDERVDYTNLLFDIIAMIAPAESGGSVSTVPGSFKPWITDESQVEKMRQNVTRCAEHIRTLSGSTGKDLHLGMEPEPMCYFDTSAETVSFLEPLPEWTRPYVGVNYDTCHIAIQYEDARTAMSRLRDAGIRISKLHLSSALALKPTAEALERLKAFQEDVYFHQVVIRDDAAGTQLRKFADLPEALQLAEDARGEEWRVHFHIPLHAEPEEVFGNTRGHISEVLQALREEPNLCRHFEMETYTWEVLPENLRSANVVDQLVKEYDWTLGQAWP